MSKNILVVDDSSTTRSLIASHISDWGDFEVIEAGSGFEALKVLPAGEVDLIITDINMPDINGLELVNFVREHPVHRRIPIIIITTEASAEDRRRGMELGAKDYLVKPIDMEELHRAVSRLIG